MLDALQTYLEQQAPTRGCGLVKLTSHLVVTFDTTQALLEYQREQLHFWNQLQQFDHFCDLDTTLDGTCNEQKGPFRNTLFNMFFLSQFQDCKQNNWWSAAAWAAFVGPSCLGFGSGQCWEALFPIEYGCMVIPSRTMF